MLFPRAPLRRRPSPPLWCSLAILGLLVLVMIGSLYLPARLDSLVDVIWAVCAVAGVVVVAQRMMPLPVPPGA